MSLRRIFVFKRFNQSAGYLSSNCSAFSKFINFCFFFFFFFLAVYTYIQSRFYRSPEVILGKWKFSFFDLFNLCALATFQTTLLSCFQFRSWCNPFSILVETNDTKLVPIICSTEANRYFADNCWYFLAKPPNYTRAKQKQARKLLLDKQI